MTEIGATVVIHVHTAIGMTIQIATQHGILFYRGQIIARLVAGSMCMYGLVWVIHGYAMPTKGV